MATSYTSNDLEEKPWYSKDEDDIDLDIMNNFLHMKHVATPSFIKDKKQATCRDKSSSKGEVYPIDLWFILSKYIYPETIAVFAALCQDSHRTVHTASFWISLYKRPISLHLPDRPLTRPRKSYPCYNHRSHKRFYSTTKGGTLPTNLQPHCLEPRHGLCANVIKALQYLYQPFVQRHSTTYDAHKLEGTQCIRTWHKIIKNPNASFRCYFKLRKRFTHYPCCISKYKPNEIDELYFNPENEAYILTATCKNFMFVPGTAMGLLLKSICLTVSTVSYQYYKLKLVFSTHETLDQSKQTCDTDTEVILDPVVRIDVFPWWHKLYK